MARVISAAYVPRPPTAIDGHGTASDADDDLVAIMTGQAA